MLDDCRWLLYASRLCGCHPHAIRERATTVTTTTAKTAGAVPRRQLSLMLYSAIACGLYCIAAFRASGVVPCVSADAMIVGCALQQLDRYVRTLYMILTTLLSCWRHADFERAVASARMFDLLTLRYRRRRRAVDRRCRDLVQWLVIFAIHLAWLLFGTLVVCITFGKVLWFTVVIQCTTRAAFSIQIAKFCFLYDALRRRFRRLNDLCRELIDAEQCPRPFDRDDRVLAFSLRAGTTTRIGTTTVNSGAFKVHAGRRLTISDLYRSHRFLADATNHLSSYYSPQLFCWFVCMLTDIVTYVFFALYNVNSPGMVCAQCLMLLYLSLQVVATSRVCHSTCDQANALARTVFSTEAAARFEHTEFGIEAIELGMHLHAHPLRVKVSGLFDLDSRFAFSAFCVILMYVILASSIH